jgi:hypothetical protein
MVNTRPKNQNTHPAAPVMTQAAKIKAGIIPKKPRQSKMPSKAEQIRILEARIAAFENPEDDAMPISQEPLVSLSFLFSVPLADLFGELVHKGQ